MCKWSLYLLVEATNVLSLRDFPIGLVTLESYSFFFYDSVMLEYAILMFLKQHHFIRASILRGVYVGDDGKSSSHVFHLLKVVSKGHLA